MPECQTAQVLIPLIEKYLHIERLHVPLHRNFARAQLVRATDGGSARLRKTRAQIVSSALQGLPRTLSRGHGSNSCLNDIEQN